MRTSLPTLRRNFLERCKNCHDEREWISQILKGFVLWRIFPELWSTIDPLRASAVRWALLYSSHHENHDHYIAQAIRIDHSIQKRCFSSCFRQPFKSVSFSKTICSFLSFFQTIILELPLWMLKVFPSTQSLKYVPFWTILALR